MQAQLCPPAATRKVIETDLRTHRVRTVEGSNDFYGHPLDENGQVGPELMVQTLHPDDKETFLDIAEQSETLKASEELRYELRALHAEGHWVRAACRTTALEWDPRGFAVVIRTEVQMIPLSLCLSQGSEVAGVRR